MESVLSKACTIKISNFEGPFDLLFHLIEKNKIDIYDIPISEITDQYMDYLFRMQEMDLEIASEFLVMAATLLHIKSKMLLPSKNEKNDEEQVDPRDELVEKLIEYRKFKNAAIMLKEREQKWSGYVYKKPEIFKIEKEYKPIDMSVEQFAAIFRNIAERYNLKQRNSVKIQEIIRTEKVTLRHKIKEIIGLLMNKAVLKFSEIFNLSVRTKVEVVTGFLAVLELAKVKKVTIEQKTKFGDITIIRKSKKENLLDESYEEAAAADEIGGNYGDKRDRGNN